MLNFAHVQSEDTFFTAPKRVEIRETTLPELQADEVLVETICSAISAGTEMLVYRGQFPHLTDAHDSVSSELKYPLAYGYACVGRVKEIGKEVNRNGKTVWFLHSTLMLHLSSFPFHP
jgi:NADPH:quinone reductase-like Zn-dependent oxidoreductase